MDKKTLNTFLSELKTWIETKCACLPGYGSNFYEKGGWEGWAQVELFMYYQNAGYDILREVQCYNDSRLRVDLIINSQIPDDNKCIRNIAVEIKCGCTTWHDTCFKSAVSKDMEKLQYLDSSYARVSLVFAATPSQIQILENENFRIFTNSYRTMAFGYKVL